MIPGVKLSCGSFSYAHSEVAADKDRVTHKTHSLTIQKLRLLASSMLFSDGSVDILFSERVKSMISSDGMTRPFNLHTDLSVISFYSAGIGNEGFGAIQRQCEQLISIRVRQVVCFIRKSLS